MRCAYALAGLSILLAACGTGEHGSENPVAPLFSGLRGYNEVTSGSGWVRASQDDYAPGETVTILAGGWEPGETVIMMITEEPDVQEDLVLTSIADSDGNFVNSDFAVTEIHLGVVFTLTAEGQSSGMTASTMFNDGMIQDASIEMRDPACSSAQGTVTLGSTICAYASFSIDGTGGTDVQFRWKSPAGTIVSISQTTAFGNLGAGLHTGLSRQATFTPTALGTWTVYLCQGMDSNLAPGGQARCAGNTGSNPLGGMHRATQTFTVTSAPPSDTEAPTLNCTVPDQTLWYGDNVTVSCTASDAGSGLANSSDASFSLSTNIAADNETANAQTGSHQVCDNAGNCVTAGPYSFKVDLQGPVVTLVCPAASLIIGATANASWTAADGGSGVATGFGSGNIALDTSSVGAKTATAPAGTSKDNVDNQSGQQTCGYSVAYDFQGFYAPVDNPILINVAKAGQAIPLKWRLLDANGNPILNLTSVTVTATSLACDLGASADMLEEYSSGASGLQNLGGGYYQFNWKTPSNYAKSCKTLKLDLGEALPHTALFQFTR